VIGNLFSFLQNVVEQEPSPEADNLAIPLAAAVLMFEVSRSDETKLDIELEQIAAIVKDNFGLASGPIADLLAAANEKVETANDLYQFTQVINEHYDYAAKKSLIFAMWQVAFADGRIDAFEDHIIRRIAGLLNIAHSDFIREKIRARDS